MNQSRRNNLYLATLLMAVGFATPAFGKPLPLNKFVEWSAEKPGVVATYEVAGLSITLKSRAEDPADPDSLVTPEVVVKGVGTKPVTMTGEVSRGFGQSIGVGPLARGAKPTVIFQSFSGGAHCCTSVKGLVPTASGYVEVELGGGDGGPDEIFPKDISGDGIVDFVQRDGIFNYAFSSYAGSYPPPQISNLVGSKMVDVSTRPAFKPLFLKFMADARKACMNGEVDRNGACAGYAAAAARVGQFPTAFREVLTHYDRQATDFPSSCAVSTIPCPAGQEVQHDNFPKALRAFLIENGYLRERK